MIFRSMRLFVKARVRFFVQSFTSYTASDSVLSQVWESPKLSQDASPVLRGQKDGDYYIERARTYKERKLCQFYQRLTLKVWWRVEGGEK